MMVSALRAVAAVGASGLLAGPRLAVGTGASTAPTPSEVVSQAIHDLAGISTLTFSGVIDRGRTRISFDLRSAEHGAKSTASISEGTEAFSVIHIDSTLDLQTNAAFWATNGGGLPSGLVKLRAPHSVTLPAAEGKSFNAAFGPLADPEKMADQLFGGSLTGVRLAGVTTFGDLPVRKLVDQGDDATVDIARTNTPLPVEFIAHQKSDAGLVRFGYPAAVTLTAPAGAKSLRQLLSGMAGKL